MELWGQNVLNCQHWPLPGHFLLSTLYDESHADKTTFVAEFTFQVVDVSVICMRGMWSEWERQRELESVKEGGGYYGKQIDYTK